MYAFANHTIAYNYTEPGDYDVEFTIRGYTSFDNMVDDNITIELIPSSERLLIGEDFCEIVGDDPSSATTWSFGAAAAASMALVGWMFL
jgi:hypothetical protein